MLAYAVALPWGPIGVALAFSASIVGLRLPSILYCFRGTGLRLTDVWMALWRPAVSSIAGGALLFVVDRISNLREPLALALGFDFLVYVAFYILVWIGLPGGKRSFVEIMGIVRELRPSSSGPEEAAASETDIS